MFQHHLTVAFRNFKRNKTAFLINLIGLSTGLACALMIVAALSKYFAGLAILISCLGLFGLTTFTAERRKKEIGIRKILGASVLGIVRMLSSDFTKTVILAILIALPTSYLLAKNWLADFAIQINLNAWYFIVPGLLVLLIAWGTMSMQTIKVAFINPVDCLKEE